MRLESGNWLPFIIKFSNMLILNILLIWSNLDLKNCFVWFKFNRWLIMNLINLIYEFEIVLKKGSNLFNSRIHDIDSRLKFLKLISFRIVHVKN